MVSTSEVLMSREPREEAGFHAPHWQEKPGLLGSFKSPLGFALVPVCCGTHCRKQIQILAGGPGGQISVVSQPYRQNHSHPRPHCLA